jgi:CUG-BP- and ETR3-like factor
MVMPYPGMSGGAGGGAGMRGPPGAYGQYFPASSPGPPIQTTASNKGPDGANLFIFHIPNHFTNIDMYQLFCVYGNLLSVRIMVERDTGRSRGFGFVSYDAPESAALAIKELNGFSVSVFVGGVYPRCLDVMMDSLLTC